MSRDNISSGELDRINVIAACLDVEERILDARRERREAAIAYEMAPPQGRISHWLGLDPVTRTREEAEERADNPGDLFGPEHAWLHSSQLSLAREIRNLAEASRAPTIRITREDFGAIKNAWGRVTAPKPQKTTAELYPGAECDTCGWFGPRSELDEIAHDGEEHCPACKSTRTNWLDEEQFEEARKENAA